MNDASLDPLNTTDDSEVTDLLARLDRAGVRLELVDGRMRVTAPRGVVDEGMRDAIRRLGPLLRTRISPVAMPSTPGHVADLEGPASQEAAAAGILVPFSEGRGAAVYFVHALLGDVACYLDLASAIGDRIAVIGLQASDAETLPGSLDELADAHATTIIDSHPEGPLVIAGWSFGGLLAYAVAGKLVDRGERVGAVVLIDTHLATGWSQSDARRWQLYARLVTGYEQVTRHPAYQRLRNLPAEDRFGALATLMEEAPDGRRRYGWTDDRLRAAFGVMDRLCDLAAIHSVRPAGCPVVLFDAAGGPDVGRWFDLAPECHVVRIPGDHWSIVRSPACRLLADAITQIVSRQR